MLPRKGLSLRPRLKLRERLLLRLRLRLLLSLRSLRYLPLRRGAGDADLVGERRRRTGEGDREYREAGVGERPYRSRDGDRESMAGEASNGSGGFVAFGTWIANGKDESCGTGGKNDGWCAGKSRMLPSKNYWAGKEL